MATTATQHHPKEKKKSKKSKSHRRASDDRRHDHEDGEEYRKRNRSRRASTTSTTPTHHHHHDEGERVAAKHGEGRYKYGGKMEEEDRKYGIKARSSSHHHRHDKKEMKERRRSSQMEPRRRRTSTTSSNSHHYHGEEEADLPTTTTATRTSSDLLSSRPPSPVTSTTSGHHHNEHRHGRKYYVPATIATTHEPSWHSQASDEAVVGMGIVPLVKKDVPSPPQPPLSSTSISISATDTYPLSFYRPKKKKGAEKVQEEDNIKRREDKNISHSSSSSSPATSSSSSSSSNTTSSSSASSSSDADEKSSTSQSSSVEGSVDITASTHDDHTHGESTNTSAEERYQQQRLEEYAGKRALRRLEQELADHAELSNPIHNNNSSSNVGEMNQHHGSEIMGMNKSSGSQGSIKRRSSITTTSLKKKSSSDHRILDRRKFNRVPQVKKSDLIIGEYLGRGNFCDVFEVTWILPEQQVQLQQLQQQWHRHHQQQKDQNQHNHHESFVSLTKLQQSSTTLQQSSSTTFNSSSSNSQLLHDSMGGGSSRGGRGGGGDGAGTRGTTTGVGRGRGRGRGRSSSIHNMESSLESLALSCSNDLTVFDDYHDRLANRRSMSQVRTSQSLGTSSTALDGAGLGGSGGGRDGGVSGGLRNPNVLALKCLRPAVRAQPRKFVIGAEDLAHETALLACLDHPNIIQLYGRAEGCFSTAFQMRRSTKNDSPSSSASERDGGGGMKKKQLTNEGYFIILDRLMSTLTDRIEEWKDECYAINITSTDRDIGDAAAFSSSLPVLPIHPPEATLREHLCKRLKVAYCIADALAYLHTCHIVFRDLKPANVGFDCNDCVKMFDFGFATSIAPLLSQPYDGYGPLTETCGTRRYMAPEVALKLGYGKEVDVYSFGMLLWEICALDRPFNSIHTVEAFHDVVVLCGKRPSLKTDPLWPASLKRLMSQCWDTDPAERPTMGQVKSLLCNVLRDMNNAMEKGTSGGGGGGRRNSRGGGVGGTSGISGDAGKAGSRSQHPHREPGGNFIQKWKRRVTIT